MLPALQSLIAAQELDTAAEAARRRSAELPAVEQQLDQQVAAAAAAVEQVKGQWAVNQSAHRELEKQVAVVDGRLARFDDHKAAVKTNQEFTALLHEIEVARGGKDTLETDILSLLEDADRITAAMRDAERLLTTARTEADAAKAALKAEATALEAELTRLTAERAATSAGLDATLLARYEQLLKQRRMVAVVPLKGEVCGGCNVRLRPAVCQDVRRGTEIFQCDSCQRMLYPMPVPAPVEGTPEHAAGS